MNKKQIADDNKILVIRSGSHLYGTNTPESDSDFIGVFMPPENCIFGFSNLDEIDLSHKDKTEDGKNTSSAIDIKFYEFRKFVKLAMDNNPNILELLFVNSENVVYCNEFGRRLLDINHLFPHKGLINKFLGYSFQQKRKMFIKTENFFDFLKAQEWCQNVKEPSWHLWMLEPEMDLTLFIKQINKVSGKIDFYKIGDINLQPSWSVSKALQIINQRLDAVGNRKDLYLKHAFDTKFAMHLIRLLIECKTLLKNGSLSFPLPEANMLRSIRQGKMSINEVLSLAATLEEKIKNMKTKLTEHEHKATIEKICINLMKGWLTQQEIKE